MSAGRKDPCTDIKWDIRISNLDSSPGLIEKDAECSCLKFRIQTCQIWCVEPVNMTFRSFFEIMRPHDISRLQFGRKETPVSRHQNAKKLCVASSASVKSRWVWWLCAPEWTFLRSRWYPTVLKPDTQTKNLVIASKERQRFFYDLVLALCFFCCCLRCSSCFTECKGLPYLQMWGVGVTFQGSRSLVSSQEGGKENLLILDRHL